MKILVCEGGCEMLYSIGLDDRNCPNENGMLIEVEMDEEEVRERVLKQLEADKGREVVAFSNRGNLWSENETMP